MALLGAHSGNNGAAAQDRKKDVDSVCACARVVVRASTSDSSNQRAKTRINNINKNRA